MGKTNNFDEVILVLKNKLNIKTSKDLAERLNLTSTAFSERKRTNSIPFNEIIELCIKEKIDLNEIFFNTLDENIEITKEMVIPQLDLLNKKQLKAIYDLIQSVIN